LNPAKAARQTLSDRCAVRQPWIEGFPHMLVVCVCVPSAEDLQSVNLQRDALFGACVDARHLHRGSHLGYLTANR
jgi:hypothetical protein